MRASRLSSCNQAVSAQQWLLALFCAAAPLARAAEDSPALRITEFVAANSGGFLDEDGEASDWIELQNSGSAPLHLEGWSLSDTPGDPRRWMLPNRVLPAEAYLIVFASGKDRSPAQGSLHANFRLDKEGESLLLTAPTGERATGSFAAPYPTQLDGISYGVAANGSWQYFLSPSPGQPNAAAGVLGFAAEPRFTTERGVFDAPFDLEITCETPGSSIVYTTNGEVPNLFNGIRVNAAGDDAIPRVSLHVSESTVLRAAAQRGGYQSSSVHTHTYLFPAGVVRQSPGGEAPPGWPESSVNGQLFDYGMDPEIAGHPEYGPHLESALKSLPSVSLVTSLSNLIHPLRGIYVNAEKDGRAWERHVSVELLRNDGIPGFHVDGGLRIRGGFSRGDFNPKHSFRLFFRPEYGSDSLRYPLFETEGAGRFENLDLITAQNYAWSNDTFNDARRNTFLREVFARDTQAAMGRPYTRSRYVHLYLNGVYWGLYLTQERAEADYAQSYFGGRAASYDVVKVEAGPYTIAATDGTLEAYARLHAAVGGPVDDSAYFALQGFSPNAQIDPALERHLDPGNLIDYMLIIFYTGSFDAPLAGSGRANNFYAIRNRETRDAWRFFCHDMEHAMIDVNENRIGPFASGNQFEYFNPQWLHQQLSTSPAYRLEFADHVRKHFFHDGILTPTQALARWRTRSAQIDLAIIAESARWGDQHEAVPYTHADWIAEVERVAGHWFPARTAIVLRQIQNAGLYPSVDAPEFSQHGGWIASPGFFTLQMTAGTLFRPMPGDFYFTIDGGDPRLPDNTPNPTALVYDRDGDGVALRDSGVVRARLLHTNGIWSALTEAAFYTSRPAAPGSLAITEIMYHPAHSAESDPRGEFDADDFEFLELRNLSHERISLEGVRLVDGVEFDFSSGTILELDGGARVLVVRNAAAFAARYGTGLPVAGSYGTSGASALSNGGEGLRLTGPDGVLLHEVLYSDSAPWPSEADGAGFSLVSNRDPSSSPADWVASAAPGGSPGRAEPSTVLTLAEWMRAHGISDPHDDPDADGWSHALEYAAGSDPFHPDSGPALSVQSGENGNHVISYLSRAGLDSGLLTVEYSTDLLAWSPLPAHEKDETIPTSHERLQIRRFAPAASEIPEGYYRLRIHFSP